MPLSEPRPVFPTPRSPPWLPGQGSCLCFPFGLMCPRGFHQSCSCLHLSKCFQVPPRGGPSLALNTANPGGTCPSQTEMEIRNGRLISVNEPEKNPTDLRGLKKKKKMMKNQLYFKCDPAVPGGGLGVFMGTRHHLEGRGVCLCWVPLGCEVWLGASAALIGKCLWPGNFPGAETPAPPVIPLGLD